MELARDLSVEHAGGGDAGGGGGGGEWGGGGLNYVARECYSERGDKMTLTLKVRGGRIAALKEALRATGEEITWWQGVPTWLEKIGGQAGDPKKRGMHLSHGTDGEGNSSMFDDVICFQYTIYIYMFDK